jgi:dihydrofolate reductase
MRKLKLAMYVSLDGVVEDPAAWTMAFWDDRLSDLQEGYLFDSEALVLGRVTYEGFAAAWPTMQDTGEFGEKMNSMPKYVASRTLDRGEWNAEIMQGDVATEVGKLKAQPGGDLLVYGSGDLVDELTRHGLIDEYRLMVHPVVVGAGKRIFNGGVTATLGLVDTVTTGTGVVVSTYTLAGESKST